VCDAVSELLLGAATLTKAFGSASAETVNCRLATVDRARLLCATSFDELSVPLSHQPPIAFMTFVSTLENCWR
jgi:hypothetical protein